MKVIEEGGYRLFEEDIEIANGLGVVPPADLLCGVGNKFVVDAKRQLLGQCGIDLLAGLTEIVIIAEEIARQLEILPTCEIAEISWHNYGKIYVADDKDESIRLSDDYTPEHLEIHAEDVEYYFARLYNYGSLFSGEETTVA